MDSVVNVGPEKTRGENSGGLRWGIERRLQFIEFRLFWEGGVNRADIIEAFDVSVPQASKDLSLYQERAPDNAVYDKHAKRYVAGKNFEPHFLQPDADGYLSRLRSIADGLITPAGAWIAEPLPVEVTLSPRREISPKILRVMLSTVRAGKSIEVLYQSMSTRQPEPIWRKISPHAFGFLITHEPPLI